MGGMDIGVILFWVLVVDDDFDVFVLLECGLWLFGFEVVIVVDGVEVLCSVIENWLDVIVFDINMLVFDGVSVVMVLCVMDNDVLVCVLFVCSFVDD